MVGFAVGLVNARLKKYVPQKHGVLLYSPGITGGDEARDWQIQSAAQASDATDANGADETLFPACRLLLAELSGRCRLRRSFFLA